MNTLIKENIKLLPNVQMIDHTNLHNTEMIILHDKKHLNRDSLSIFARNLRGQFIKESLFTMNHHHLQTHNCNYVHKLKVSTFNTECGSTCTSYSEVVRRSYSPKLAQQDTGANQQPFDPPHADVEAGVKSYSMQSQIPVHSQYYLTTTVMFGNPVVGFPNVPMTDTVTRSVGCSQ